MKGFRRVALFATGLVCGFALSTVQAAPYPSPTDWRTENIYQILTDRFYDGDPSNNNAESSHGSPYAPTNSVGLHGGDFKGIQTKLDYIKSLGATAIWISPIPLNQGGTHAYHGYHAQDYYKLAPHWGTMTDLSNMVQAAHAHGIKVILDIVLNHTAKLLTSTDSGWPSYIAPPGGYHLSYISTANEEAFPFNPTNVSPPVIQTLYHTNGNIGNFSFPGSTQQVVLGQLNFLDDLATETTYVRTNMMNIYTNWVGLGDFDGFRIDTAIEVDYGFYQYWCPQLHQFGTSIGKSNFFMFGEAFNGSDQYVGSYTGTMGGGPFKYDSMLDYPLYELVNSVFANASGNTKQIETHYNNIPTYYDSNSWYTLVTFLDNHDNPRFLSSGNANNNTNRLTVALEFLYTSRGIPCLYYGTEQAFNGGADPANREDMFDGGYEQGPSIGDNFNETHPLFQLVAKLNNFRRIYPSLQMGVHSNRWNDPNGAGLFAYARVLSNEETFVVFNTAGSNQTLSNRVTSYLPGTVLVNLLNTNETITIDPVSNTPTITVPGTSAKIFIAQSWLKPLDPVVISQSPTHAQTNVATTAKVVLQFSKPMNTNSVQAAFSVTPATPGIFTWNTIHDTMTVTPIGIWPAVTTNLIHLATNAVDSVNGNSFYAPFDTYFVTTTNNAVTCTISGPNSVCANSSSLGYTVLPSVPGASVNWSISGNGSILGPPNTTSVLVNAGGTGSFTVLATVAANSTTSSCLEVATINPSLLAYWTFDEGSGSVANDSSGNSNTGTVVTNISDGGPGPWSPDGLVNGALYCNGEHTQVIVSNSPSLNPNNGITVAAWVNAVGWDNSPRILEKGVSDNQYALLAQSNQIEFLLAGVTNGILVASVPSTGMWHHLAGTYDGSLISLYIDGQLTTQQVAAGAMPVTTDALGIGNKPGGSLFNAFYGDIDDVRIYCSALSSVQIAQLYNIDSVSDGIPNRWRAQYFGTGSSTNATSCAVCDADGDGMSNLQEFLAGTDPTDPNSAFRITAIGIAGNDVAVTWTTQPNKTNQLESSAAPNTNATWLSVGPLTIGTGSPATQTDQGAATNSPAHYYRVRLVP